MTLINIFLVCLCILISFNIGKETENELEKIKNVTISMLEIHTNDKISFSLRYKNTILKFINYSFFDLLSNNIYIIQDTKDDSKYIIKNITIFFKSDIEINNVTTTKIELLFQVYFDKFVFQKNNLLLKILEVYPSSLYISQNSQIGKLSYFNKFNNFENGTFLDENGEKFENVDIISTFLDISKRLIMRKISNVEKFFNILTYDLDKILNNVIGEYYLCPEEFGDVYQMSSIKILSIKIPLKYIYFDEERLIIDRMDVKGNFFSRPENKIENFSYYNDDEDNIFFEKDLYSLVNIKENKMNCTGGYVNRQKICEGLNFIFKIFVEKVIENYYSQ